jgi:hypothetical protein
VEGNVEGMDLQSSLTITISLSDGEQPINNPIPQVNPHNEEVNQQATDQQLDDEIQFVQEDVIIPVNVQGDAQALNMDNFMQLGVGMQNIMMAYHDIGDLENEEDEVVSQPENDLENAMYLDDNLSDPNLEMFHFHDFVPLEVAHLQLGMVKTHLFLRKDTKKFSAEGMHLWEKYFAPHIMDQMNNSSCRVLEIPTNWFNFITLMLLSPEKFDWTKKFLNSSLWNIIKENEEQECISFIVPEKFAVSQAPKCSISVLGESSQDVDEEMPLHPPSAPKSVVTSPFKDEDPCAFQC